MRRCEWMTRSPSKRSSRCLPRASTAVTARPAQPLRPAVARRSAGAASPSRPARGPPAPAGSGWPRSGSCRPPARLKGTVPVYVVSVSRRGPARKPSSSSALLVRRAHHRLAVDALEPRRRMRPRLTLSASAASEGSTRVVVRVDEHLQALAAALDEQHGLGAGQHDVGAGLAGGAARGAPATSAPRRRAARDRWRRARAAARRRRRAARAGARPRPGSANCAPPRPSTK